VAGILLVPISSARAGLSDSREFAELIYEGQFAKAQEFLSARPVEVVGEEVKYIQPELTDFCRLEQLRLQAKTETYQEAEAKAKEQLGAGEIDKALASAQKARSYAEDAKAFGEQEWVKQIAAEALLAAEKFLKDYDWLKAGNIYAELAEIYPDQKQYESKTEDCVRHVRVESIYKSDSDWKDQLAGIHADDVIAEVSPRIQDSYVEPPDMQKMALAGLQSLAILGKGNKLQETFPVLTDQVKRLKFEEEIGKLIDKVNSEDKEQFNYKKFWWTFLLARLLNQNTLELPEELIVREFLDGAMDELDKFSGVIWPYEMEDFQKHTVGRFSGVGILISMEKSKLTVVTPIPDTPAYRAGIVPDDLIVSIDGESSEGITLNQAVRKITGPRGTKVVLGILHPWEEYPREIALTRDTIVIQSVKGLRMGEDHKWRYFVDPAHQIGYIRLTSFTEEMVSELREVLEELRSAGVKGLIIDLRFNPGGTLSSAVQAADLFLSKGQIVSTKGRNTPPRHELANRNGLWLDQPMIVLISKYSASASEILAGALQDHHRALIIGERSFGKGSVQHVIPIADGNTSLKLTTAYYYLPSGRCLHKVPDAAKWGVDPDLEVKLMPSELVDLMDIQRESEILRTNGQTTAPTTAETTTTSSMPTTTQTAIKPARKYPPTDIQLKVAELVLRARLACDIPWQAPVDEIPPADTMAGVEPEQPATAPAPVN
jgi:carboxyl-terminal processing protease